MWTQIAQKLDLKQSGWELNLSVAGPMPMQHNTKSTSAIMHPIYLPINIYKIKPCPGNVKLHIINAIITLQFSPQKLELHHQSTLNDAYYIWEISALLNCM